MLARPSRCHNCDARLESGAIVRLEARGDDEEVRCLKCAGLSAFAAVYSGNAALTRLASKYSPVRYVIMQWSELWKCYERKGVLVERQALEKAQAEAGRTS